MTPAFRAIDPTLHIAAASVGEELVLRQLFVLNLPGQLPEHLFQKQAREGDISGVEKKSLGEGKGMAHTLEMDYMPQGNLSLFRWAKSPLMGFPGA